MPLTYFPTRIEVWDADGRVTRTLATRPLIERVAWGGDGAQAGPRNPSWRADAAATITWVEALDGGDPARAAEKRDRILMLEAPFAGEPRTLLETEWRARGITWARADLAIAREGNSRQRKARTWVIDPSGKVAYNGAIDDKRSANVEDVKTAKNFVAAALDEMKAGKPVSNASNSPYGCTIKYK